MLHYVGPCMWVQSTMKIKKTQHTTFPLSKQCISLLSERSVGLAVGAIDSLSLSPSSHTFLSPCAFLCVCGCVCISNACFLKSRNEMNILAQFRCMNTFCYMQPILNNVRHKCNRKHLRRNPKTYTFCVEECKERSIRTARKLKQWQRHGR